MKRREFKALCRRLLPDLPGWACHNSLLFIAPMGHTLRAVGFDESVDPRGFYVHVFFQPLFVPSDIVWFNLGWRLGGGSHTWNADAPKLVGQLGAALKREAVPFLSRIESPKAVAEAALSLGKERDPHVVRAIAYAYARAGDVERAKRQFQQLWNLLNPAVSWHQEMGDQARGLEALLLSDPEAAQRKLREWEGETLRNLGLDEFK